MRTLYRIQLIAFRESFVYPRDITLDFFGCEPLIWREGVNNRISGLPRLANKENIGFENRCSGKIVVFRPEDGPIPWKSLFEDLSKITFHDDLD